jgi:hypothetical protein
MNTIPLKPVKSSNLEAIGHDGTTLAVQFKGGAVHHYKGVPAELYDKLASAESPGSIFHKHIRSEFPSERIPVKDKQA